MCKISNPIGKDNKSRKVQKESVQIESSKSNLKALQVIPTCACPSYRDCVSNCFYEHLRLNPKFVKSLYDCQ